jgi:hypothetical protein
MRIKFNTFIALVLFSLLLSTCTENVETEFGRFCAKTTFITERHYFSSDIDGSVKFQLDESMNKSDGKLIIGGFTKLSEGLNELHFDVGSDPQNCTDCIFMFSRKDPDRIYRAVSGRIDIELLYFDTKGRVAFATGRFQRMVFTNENGSDCAVIEEMEFKLY